MIWTVKMVESHLEAAAETLRRLPDKPVPGFYNCWPAVLRTAWETAHFDAGPTRPSSPTPTQVSTMEQTLMWLRLLDVADQRIVWQRVSGKPMKAIAADIGVHRSTLWRRCLYAFTVIAAHLNAQDATSSRHRKVRQIGPNVR